MSHIAPPSERSGRSSADVPSPDDPTIGRLVADATRDLSSLLHNEIALAKSELRVSLKNGGTGAGLFAAAAFLVLLAVVMISIAFAFFITMAGLDPAWAFLIVFGVYVVIAAILAAIGVRKVKRVRAPQRAIHQAQEAKTLLKRS